MFMRTIFITIAIFIFPISVACAITCDSNQYTDGEYCYTCPANATCDGINFTCVDGWYKNGGICEHCAVENASCTGPDDYVCWAGYYDESGVCNACPEHATCAGGNEYFHCNSGYYKYQSICLSCAGHLCDGDILISCGDGYRLHYNKCEKCATFHYCPAGTTSIICNSGYYKDGNGNCQECPTGYYCPLGESNGANLYDYCAVGYYRTGNSCSKCENDIVCPGGKIDDIVCPSGLHKHDNGQCLDYAPGDCGDAPNCNPGCYNNDGECIACHVENATCTSANNFTCMTGYYNTGTSCNICPQNSSCPIGTTQINCLPGYYLDGDECPQCGNESVYCVDNVRYECPQYVPGSLDSFLPTGHTVINVDVINALGRPIQNTINDCSLEAIRISAPQGNYEIKWSRWKDDSYNASIVTGTKYWYSANPGYYLSVAYSVNGILFYLNINQCTNGAANSYYTGAGSIGGNDCPWICNDGYYRDGDVCLVCPDGMECVGGGIICPAGMYANKNLCLPCPTGYVDAPDGGAQSVNSCQKRCDGGYYIASAQSDKCENVGAGYWIGENYTNYGAIGVRNACGGAMTTIGYGSGADDAGDCGRVLHIGDAQVYLRSNQITTPSLIVQYADNLFYGNMSTTERGNLRIQIGDIVYSVYDDSML